MTALVLPLKGEYFDAIRDGTKAKEYRLVNDYWCKRLIGRSYTRIELTKGYPKASDKDRRISRAWRGYSFETITHPHFGAEPVRVFAIDVTEPIAGLHSEPLIPNKKTSAPESTAPEPALSMTEERHDDEKR